MHRVDGVTPHTGSPWDEYVDEHPTLVRFAFWVVVILVPVIFLTTAAYVSQELAELDEPEKAELCRGFDAYEEFVGEIDKDGLFEGLSQTYTWLGNRHYTRAQLEDAWQYCGRE